MSLPTQFKLQRVDQTIPKLIDSVYIHLADLKAELWRTDEPVTYSNRMEGEYSVVKTGDVWGKLWDCAWFHFSGIVPESAAGSHVVLLIDLGGEGLVVDSTGNPKQGLTSISSGFDFSLGKPGKRVFPFANPAQGNEVVDVWVDAGLNDLFGSLPNGGKLDEARIACRRDHAQALAFDFEVLRELVNHLPAQSARYASLVHALYNASLALSHGCTDQAIHQASEILAKELSKKGGDPSLTISAIGHAHIDLAWLWPIRETIRKGARTFSTVLRMMERYPDYVFGASQPQLYQWMKDHYPALYAEIKQRIAEGRWEVQGAMWVEPDANVPSGESLVRQILYGKKFYRDEFGIDVTNLWMPDVFGYSGSIPQILRKAGIDTFLTQKLSWSLFNQHPHHTFHWEGIDGSTVLVHMPPESTYNSSAAPRAIAKAETDYLDKDVSDECLLLFGIGDGGGGPGEEHLERLVREKNLAGLSPVVQESSDAFFRKLKATHQRYAKWSGELYLERHQGTLTSQARNKRYNRKLEFSLRELEYVSARSQTENSTYPKADLERIWKEVLLYQFHDILPGSSITRVFTESVARYGSLTDEVNSLQAAADRSLLGIGDRSFVSNSLSWSRSEWLKVDGEWHWVEVPPLGFAEFKPCQLPVAPIDKLENEFLVVDLKANELTGDHEIVSIWDKEANRELIRPGGVANQLAIFDDQGDAWDFPVDYDAVPQLIPVQHSAEWIQDGPKTIFRRVLYFGQTTIHQDIVLTQGSRRIDFVTKVDWKEQRKMLRVLFPVAIHADTARSDIQFGSIERPTHANTSWDWAKDEICAQKWVDISEPGYGVALLNDCKYGHRVRDGILDLNLLRSATYPDPVADQATHEFTYSLYPHLEGFAEGRVVQAAYELNVPLRLVKGEVLPSSLAIVDIPGVVIDTVKKAENSEALIFRLVELYGRQSTATIQFGNGARQVEIVNLMEEDPTLVDLNNSSVTVEFRPFEIITLKVH